MDRIIAFVRAIRWTRTTIVKSLPFVSIIILGVAYLCRYPTKLEYRIVSSENGFIRGIVEHSLRNNKEIIAFRGIPYARPPIGARRFKVKNGFCSCVSVLISGILDFSNCWEEVGILWMTIESLSTH